MIASDTGVTLENQHISPQDKNQGNSITKMILYLEKFSSGFFFLNLMFDGNFLNGMMICQSATVLKCKFVPQTRVWGKFHKLQIRKKDINCNSNLRMTSHKS